MKRLVTAKGMFVPEPYDSQLQLKGVNTDADLLLCSFLPVYLHELREILKCFYRL